MTTAKKTTPTLTGVPETLLGTVMSKAADAISPSPILRDTWAAEILTKVDYDFSRLGVSGWLQAWAVVRSRDFDRWTSEFLDLHAHSPNGATVVHLACGLDTRALRLRRYFSRMALRWIDIDLPDVVKMRRELVPDPLTDTDSKPCEGSTYELRASSATERGWYLDIPADRPTVIVIEGLSMYLAEEEMRGLVRGLVDHFGQGHHGHLIFDATNSFVMAAQGWLNPVAKSGSKLNWWCDNPLLIEAWAEDLTLREELLLSGRPLMKQWSWKVRLQYAIAASLPWVYHFHRMMRFSF
ncbi:O-methyltransferase [Colletotrichum graminicola M1.001]|uniref:O-methyltransferase n=1 Tax=Colletotrichum graminicola (strain M1.001 / M2 / FGSC 10212) TaxID=645133 RepID=E3QTD7_COLGM|nr:O-methyltransferase [Colletotrichum graminicola M1.001]EFQ34125.1 O-methyltransferase [Colletotrichum graminicola M1.001]